MVIGKSARLSLGGVILEASLTWWVLGTTPRALLGVATIVPGIYRSPTTIGNLIENLSLSMSTACWYWIAIPIVAPGAILATLVVKILGRCCSTNEALLPSDLAFS